jgi:hypothetical protein
VKSVARLHDTHVGSHDLTRPSAELQSSAGIRVAAFNPRNGPRCVGPVNWRETAVLETIAIILLVLWLLGVVSGYTLGNFIYVLLVIAIILFLVRLVSGRRVV